MATEAEKTATLVAQLKGIKDDTEDIKAAVFGNGSKGLKVKVVILEVKFWILLILVLPIWYCSVRLLLHPEIFNVVQAMEQVFK